ncbi:3-hydroxyacyl-[acyl-carrier-protein] dehydratase FabZ [Kocuria sp. 2SI]|uniref:3-hydroxyacyl-ACP dehydratase FabZ family protein n=1 Tax=Kocuria sp. 2SI TaxID=2502203 RepID=UPI0010F7B7BC|nr:3-hydroxyacyl-[acyl-carrier-protein] dehydratase FabZ [Kocuria sp. 2SI]
MTQRSTTRMPQLTGVDRVTELVPGVSARGVRGVGGTMDLLDDHFPGFPVLPGVLLLGSLAELAAIVEESTTDETAAPALQLGGATRVQFRTFVRPGDVLQLEVKRTGEKTYRASASVEGKAVMKVNALRLERVAPIGAPDARGTVDGADSTGQGSEVGA